MNNESHIRPISIVLWSVLLLVVASIVLLLIFRKPPEETTASVEKPMAVQVQELQARRMAELLALPGQVEPRLTAHLGTEKPGLIVEITVDKGASVTNGQILLRLDDRQWANMQRQAEIEHREAGKEDRRWLELQKTGAVSDKDFDAVRTRFDLSEVALDAAQVSLSQCVVKSPTDGIVEARYVEEGEYAIEGKMVFTVIDVRRVKLVVEVPERDAHAVKTGDNVGFRVDAIPGHTFSGRVSFVSSMGSRESNSFRTEITVANADGRLKAGMIGEATIVRRMNDAAIVLPLAAVLPRGGEHVVFTVEDNRAVRRVVQIDSITGHEAVLSSGVTAGDRIVIEGHRALQDGTLVAIDREPARADTE